MNPVDAQSEPLRTLPAYPPSPESLPTARLEGKRYSMRFATTRAELAAIQRLRFEVFNLELGEGLERSFATGLDQDEFDESCHHLLVSENASGEVVGTYRMQTRRMALGAHGYYTAGEFDLSGLAPALLEAAIETGRACVAREHRNGRVLSMLWKGLAAYMLANRKRFLFGCCSLTSQDPDVARQTYDFLRSGRFLHPDLRTPPLPALKCYPEGYRADLNVSVKLPPLFASYLKLGAKITGEPALDRHFKTLDFLTWLDAHELDPTTYRSYFGA